MMNLPPIGEEPQFVRCAVIHVLNDAAAALRRAGHWERHRSYRADDLAQATVLALGLVEGNLSQSKKDFAQLIIPLLAKNPAEQECLEAIFGKEAGGRYLVQNESSAPRPGRVIPPSKLQERIVAPARDAEKTFENVHAFRRYLRALRSFWDEVLDAFDFSRKRFEIVNATLSRSARKYNISSNLIGLMEVEAEADRQSAAALMARETHSTSRLDVRKTIAATVRNGGLFTPRTAPRGLPIHYLVLAQRRSAMDLEFVRSCRLVASLRASGVQLTFFAYADMPTQVQRVARVDGSLGPPTSLSGIYHAFPTSRLVLLSEGTELLEPFRYLPYHWAKVLERWAIRALLTPLAYRDWEQREVALRAGSGNLNTKVK